MGYTTAFFGSFSTDRPIDQALYHLLRGLATTRRMKRKVSKKYGVDGEFYVADNDRGIVDQNRPPRTQPTLYCGWLIQPDRRTIAWDGNEKFNEYVPWLLYIIHLLKKNGYGIRGEVVWRGEEQDDVGILRLTDRKLTIIAADATHGLQQQVIRIN